MRKRHERRAILWSLGLLAVTSASCGWLRGTVTSDTGDAAVPADRRARGMALRAESAARPRRMALVVGNARYPAAIGALRNPLRDAQLMCRTLQDLGFAVTFIQDAGVERLRGAVDRFARAVQSGDIALVYYSGHGMSVEGRNYLVPVDFDGTCGASLARQLEARALSVDQMLASLSGKNSRNVLLFDACRDNPCVAAARSATRGLGRSRSVGDGLARVAAPPDSVIVYATDPGN